MGNNNNVKGGKSSDFGTVKLYIIYGRQRNGMKLLYLLLGVIFGLVRYKFFKGDKIVARKKQYVDYP